MTLALKTMLYGQKNHMFGLFTVDDMTGYLTFEFFGEALPQFILNTLYLSNNYDFLQVYDVFFIAQPVPTSLISAIFSCGTVLFTAARIIYYFIMKYGNTRKHPDPMLVVELQEARAEHPAN